MQANILAPVIVIPQDIFEPGQRFVKMDFGKITIASELLEYKASTDYKAIKNEEQLYDKYNIGLDSFSLKIIEHHPVKAGLTSSS